MPFRKCAYRSSTPLHRTRDHTADGTYEDTSNIFRKRYAALKLVISESAEGRLELLLTEMGTEKALQDKPMRYTTCSPSPPNSQLLYTGEDHSVAFRRRQAFAELHCLALCR